MKYSNRLIAAAFYSVKESGTKAAVSPHLAPAVLVSIHDIAENYCGVPGTVFGFHAIWSKLFRAEIVRQGIEFPEGIAYS